LGVGMPEISWSMRFSMMLSFPLIEFSTRSIRR
jgi:hypothetical protein